jgi:hypothetical protein
MEDIDTFLKHRRIEHAVLTVRMYPNLPDTLSHRRYGLPVIRVIPSLDTPNLMAGILTGFFSTA